MATKEKSIPAFELMKTEVFFYAGDWYTVLDEPQGEFSTTVKVLRHADNQETELYIRDGDKVVVREEE